MNRVKVCDHLGQLVLISKWRSVDENFQWFELSMLEELFKKLESVQLEIESSYDEVEVLEIFRFQTKIQCQMIEDALL